MIDNSKKKGGLPFELSQNNLGQCAGAVTGDYWFRGYGVSSQTGETSTSFSAKCAAFLSSFSLPPANPSRRPSSRYIVKPGDTLFHIAHRFGIPVGTLLTANPQIRNPNLIFRGQRLFIPHRYGAPGQSGYGGRYGGGYGGGNY